jgi:cysteine desulfurase/selenocysteine lyase
MSLDVARIRGDFASLAPDRKGRSPIYFDNACMTLKPRAVVEVMNEYYERHPSCHKRAVHAFGKETTRKYAEARVAVQRHLNAADPRSIVFTRNTTEAINLVAQSLSFRPGDVVVTSDAEHNSNLLPWQFLTQARGIVHKTFALPPDATGEDLGEYRALLAAGRVRLVSVFHTSHVTGLTLPIKEIARLAHEHGALVLVDAAQGLPHQRIDVQDLDVDFLAASFHKAFGPTGMGCLYGKLEQLNLLTPFITGGETVEDVHYDSCVLSPVPERFEAGLQNYAGALGSARALQYLSDLGWEALRAHERELNTMLTRELQGAREMRIIGPADPALRGSIVNIALERLDAGEISILLDQSSRIMTRAGVHCCHAWFRKYKLKPTLRVSLAAYNTIEDAEVFIRTMRSIAKYF